MLRMTRTTFQARISSSRLTHPGPEPRRGHADRWCSPSRAWQFLLTVEEEVGRAQF